MLQSGAIEPATLVLLKKLMSIRELENFCLVGGTALALRYGHRQSVDVSELLNTYSIKDFVDCYYQKYPGQMIAISIPYALTYFADANDSEDPVSLKGQTWESVKKHIQQKVREYLS